jgi:hypothetical protein
MLSLAAAKVSLRLWKAREAYRKRLHDTAQADLNKARQADAHPRRALIQRRDLRSRQLEEARTKIALRQKQIVSINRANQQKAAAQTGVTKYDGVVVAAWMVPYLEWARAHGWRGRLVSGWRDPHYSQQLCFNMCGRPSCPGRCAGLSSNHVGSAKPYGAVDVTDYVTFGHLMQHCPYTPKLINRLGARDPVHYSASGN